MKKIIISKKYAKSLLPKRKKDSNKSTHGRCLIIAGSKQYPGSALLAARAASRIGAGYTYVLNNSIDIIQNQPELIPSTSIHNALKHKPNSVLIGPGLGISLTTKKKLLSVLKSKTDSIVIDADALNILSLLKKTPVLTHTILTPHEGELARLLKTSSTWVKKNRSLAIQKAQKKFNCIVILKGQHTLITDGNYIYENRTGNASLAKAGSGDVLAGMIVGLIAQGLSALEASILAVYLHGAIADYWLKNKNDILSLLPSDIVQLLPKILFRLRSLKT